MGGQIGEGDRSGSTAGGHITETAADASRYRRQSLALGVGQGDQMIPGVGAEERFDDWPAAPPEPADLVPSVGQGESGQRVQS